MTNISMFRDDVYNNEVVKVPFSNFLYFYY
jgi:hypothetical protein